MAAQRILVSLSDVANVTLHIFSRYVPFIIPSLHQAVVKLSLPFCCTSTSQMSGPQSITLHSKLTWPPLVPTTCPSGYN